jgi:prokaryotic ubiquitin-like protein Pup
MSAQVRKEKVTTKVATETAPEETKDLSNEELDDQVEDLLADIDDVLEVNAEEFVRDYVQKGGQ